MLEIQLDDKTEQSLFCSKPSLDMRAQFLAYGAFLRPANPSSKGYVITESPREGANGDQEVATCRAQNRVNFLALDKAQILPNANRTTGCVRPHESRGGASRSLQTGDTTAIEQHTTYVFPAIPREQYQLSRGPNGSADSVTVTELRANQRTLRILEQWHNRAIRVNSRRVSAAEMRLQLSEKWSQMALRCCNSRRACVAICAHRSAQEVAGTRVRSASCVALPRRYPSRWTRSASLRCSSRQKSFSFDRSPLARFFIEPSVFLQKPRSQSYIEPCRFGDRFPERS
jgi:hypothetical protein